MKICKYYSLDECSERKLLLRKLDLLESDAKIEYSIVDGDVIKIKDKGLSAKEKKELISLFNEYDVIDYPDYDEDPYEEEDEEDDDDDESYDDENYEY